MFQRPPPELRFRTKVQHILTYSKFKMKYAWMKIIVMQKTFAFLNSYFPLNTVIPRSLFDRLDSTQTNNKKGLLTI